jgi:flagellar motor switch protein FliN/FliY
MTEAPQKPAGNPAKRPAATAPPTKKAAAGQPAQKRPAGSPPPQKKAATAPPQQKKPANPPSPEKKAATAPPPQQKPAAPGSPEKKAQTPPPPQKKPDAVSEGSKGEPGAAKSPQDVQKEIDQLLMKKAEEDAALKNGENEVRQDDLDLILDIPIELTVRYGETTEKLGEILRVGEGSVIRLANLSGEPVDVMVNEALIARGEVVVENEKYCINIIETVNRMDRIKTLR